MTDEELYSICKYWRNKDGFQFLVYDYIKSNTLQSSEQYNELGSKCDFLKNNIAGELNYAVLAGAQLNRENKVADSDKLERYCSVSVKWDQKKTEEYLQDGEDCGNFKLSIALNRIGEQMQDGDYIDMSFDGSRMRIEEAMRQHDGGVLPF
jgi:CRISPR/Cas system CMR-associated protein Cmr3 (group 5 of RAMP superfamily)